MLAAFLTTILFSLSAVSGRRLANHVAGTQANLARLAVAALFLGIYSHAFGFGLGGPALAVLFISGCIGFGIGDLALFQAYPRLGTRRTMVLVQCLPAPIGAITEWAWLGNVPTLEQATCGAVILLGVGIALAPAESDAGPGVHWKAGVWFGVIAACCQAWGAVLSRKAAAIGEAAGEPFQGVADGANAAYQRILGGIVVSALFLVWLKVAHRPDTARKADWPRAWPWVTANALFGPTLGVTCYQWALSVEKTSIVLPIVAVTPLVVMPFTRVFEGEKFTARAILGGVVAVAGVATLAWLRTRGM
jgi:drug/metabolite transporter (DMT)-like permease